MNEAPIRFGIMCRGTIFDEWEASCVHRVLELNDAEVALLILDDLAGSVSHFRALKDYVKRTHLRNILFTLYVQLLLRPQTRRKVDIAPSLSKAAIMRCRTVKVGNYSEFTVEDIERIRGHELDFIIKFAFGIIIGDILSAARYGIWSFHHDDQEKYRGGPPCFWEIYNGDSVTGAILQRLTHRLDAGIVLKKGYLKTVSTSHIRNCDRVFFESARWPAQVCRDIQRGAADYLNGNPSRANAKIFRDPTNTEFLRFALKLFVNWLRAIYEVVFRHEQWNIGIINEPITTFLNQPTIPRVQWVAQRGRDSFLADPFGVIKHDKLTILCEEFNYEKWRGRITSLQKPTNVPPAIHEAISLPVHASYPYLFEHEGDLYCIPETADAREVVLFKASEFPKKWIKAATLVENFPAVDSTVFQLDGMWWLTCTNDQNHALHIFYATNLLGPWTPHPGNPVKIDIRSARPAGTPFFHEGNLIRPSQDCSKTYGGAIVLNRITRLTTKEFNEETITRVEADPDWPYPDGMHTLSKVGDITLIDAKRLVFIGRALPHYISAAVQSVRRLQNVPNRHPTARLN